MNYTIFNPKRPGFVLFRIVKGQTDRDFFAWVMSQVERGIGSKAAQELVCVPDIPHPLRRDTITLGMLLAPKKRRGSTAGLRPISEGDRYKGKIDWESRRSFIGEKVATGWSISAIAKELGVCRSAISKANNKHHFYPKREWKTSGKPKKRGFSTEFNGENDESNTLPFPTVESNAKAQLDNSGLGVQP